MHITHLKSALEAILFLQHKPITLNRLRDIIDETLEMDTYKEAMAELVEAYTDGGHGIEIAEIAGGFVFRTKLEHRDMIRRMNEVTPVKMSQAMLEVLSIAAFNQPVTREKIEDVRGVECGHHLRNLMEKKLVKIVGRSDAVGRPMLYGTTKEFLELFGMDTLKDLPALRDIEEMLPQNEVGEHEDEENRIRGELQEIVADSAPLEFSDLELAESELFVELDEKAKAEKEAAAQKRAEEKAAKEQADREENLQAELDAEAADEDSAIEAQSDAEADAEAADEENTVEAQSDAQPEAEAQIDEENDVISAEASVEGAHGQEEETETFADSDRGEAEDLNAAQDGEAEKAEDLEDEVAGSVAFGSVSPEQEREWHLDEKVEDEQEQRQAEQDELDAQELQEIAAAFDRERRPTETPEDPSSDGN